MSTPRLGYVVRFVAALPPAVAFYRDLLGQRLTKQTEHWAQFDCGSVRLGLYQRAAMATALGTAESDLGSPPGAVELAFEVDDVDATFAAAVGAGARGFRDPQDRDWGERTAYLLDPDGGLVELFSRPAHDGHAARASAARGADAGEEVHRQEMARPSSDPAAGLPDPNA